MRAVWYDWQGAAGEVLRVGELAAEPGPGEVRVVEVAFSPNVDLDAAVARNQTVIAAYASPGDRQDFPFWPMLFDGSDDFPPAIEATMPLEATAEAHDRVDAGRRGRVLLAIT